ncbi:MAG: SPOR domain-containing protein [Sphingobacteriales bacterium]|nr:SPOR domain-containing protein [Sphingobacteriales bacterium]
MKFSLIFLLLFSTAGAFAQADTAVKPPVDSNSVIIHKDPRLELLIKKQAEINEITGRNARKTDKGFRILIISTNSRNEAMTAKSKVYTYFPELKAYLWYQSPYFRVKAGNFLERKDAEAYQRRLNVYFPKGVYIMEDEVEMKKGKGLNDKEKPLSNSI